jgi:LmbE family N-acetylglucosaminyl deacetylase
VVPWLYSRRQFKLFLTAALGDINLRMLVLAAETDYFAGFVRPIPVKAPFGKSMLVVAPHQDDETIGCGGAMALQVRSGNSVSIVMLQDGGDEHEAHGTSRGELTALRNEESRMAAAVIGVQSPLFLNHVRLVEAKAQAAAELRAAITRLRADAVFVPFVLDAHPDHRTANQILAEALEGISWEVRVLSYEVWGLCIPNVLLVIDEVIEAKIEMLRCFKYANSAVDYVQSTVGLNMYHSKMLGANQARYIERFFELPRTEYVALVKRIAATDAQLSGRSG